MKTNILSSQYGHTGIRAGFSALVLAALALAPNARADETCSSPYLARIEGQEEFVYVWTLGVEGLGDGSDKLAVVDVKPGSLSYGQVIHTYSVGSRNEAHHDGFTDDRRQLWLASLESSRIFIFDVRSDPARPKLVKTIDRLADVTGGAIGPHGAYALPGRVLIPCLSNAKDQGGRTAPAGQHDLTKRGRQTALLHQLAPGALGQDRRGQ
jgi:selenium-binding protein 1